MIDFDSIVAESSESWKGAGGERWSRAEDDFLREHLGYLTDAEIGEELGRSENAVHLRWERDLRLSARSKTPGIITARQMADMIGIDIHSVCKLTDRGILDHRIMPGGRNIRLIRLVTAKRFVANPMNWIYFRPWAKTLPDPAMDRIVRLAQQQRWNDEWLTPGQVADIHGVLHTDVNRYINRGLIRGTKWGNWWILRSEAERKDLAFYKGKGSSGLAQASISDLGQAFMLLAYAVGHTPATIGKMNDTSEKYATYRVRHLLSNCPDQVRQAAQDLGFHFCPQKQMVWGNVLEHADRFPKLASTLDRFLGRNWDALPGNCLRNLAFRWAAWQGKNQTARTLQTAGAWRAKTVCNFVWQKQIIRVH